MPFAFPISRSALGAACLAVALWGGAGLVCPAAAETAGAYLAVRTASDASDYTAAAPYYDRLLQAMPDDLSVQEGALVTHVALGEVEKAAELAALMVGAKDPSQVAVLVSLADATRQGEFARGLSLLEGGADAGKLIGGLYRAWAFVGQGQMGEAMRHFDELAKLEGLQGFAGYQKALALALVGDFEGAEAILAGDYADIFNGTRRGVLAHVQVLSQLERNPEALALIEASFGPGLDPELQSIHDRLSAGEALPFSLIGSARDGVAESFYTVAQALNADSPSGFGLLHSRLASWLRPEHADAALLSAAILEAQGQYDLAIAAYAQIGPQSPAFHAAELGRAEAMVSAGRSDAAIEVLEQLTRTHGGLVGVWSALGDHLRQEDRFAEAVSAYDKAVELIGTPGPEDWVIFYARAISLERSGQWEAAEKGFREALRLNPDQPGVLNYLGYSYVEKKQNLTEALEMIQKAVEGRPDDAYITDSLGWAYYRLGRYEEAVVQMERSVELMPTDPLLNDHLGDVYWAVGRKREADFQWRRALNFGPAPDLSLERVRRKLEAGLDTVLAEEGAPPLHANHDGN